jgi:hypothetical protein
MSFLLATSTPGEWIFGFITQRSGLSLAYIGTASSTAQREELEHRSRRFRLGDKKEAAGAAVAVISLGCMDIECCFGVW